MTLTAGFCMRIPGVNAADEKNRAGLELNSSRPINLG
jgi:hypothetical protein